MSIDDEWINIWDNANKATCSNTDATRNYYIKWNQKEKDKYNNFCLYV